MKDKGYEIQPGIINQMYVLLCEIFSRMEKEKIPCKQSYIKGYMQAMQDNNKVLEVRVSLLEEK